MKDKTLLVICLIIAISGLSIISVGVLLNEKNVIEINKINDEDEGKIVKIKGEITDKFKTEDGHIFLDVKDKTGKIEVVLFKNDYKNMEINTKKLSKNTEITTIGRVKKYKGNLEIISRRITII